MRTAVVFMVLASSALLCVLPADGQSFQADNLDGIRTVWVGVERIPQDVVQYAPTADRLQTDIELRLRQNGIRVIPSLSRCQSLRDTLQVANCPFLFLRVNAVLMPTIHWVAYGAQLELRQDVIRVVYDTTSHSNPSVNAATWEQTWIGGVGTDRFEKVVREAVLNNLDDFINDWLSVNGPNAQSKPKDGKE